MNIALESAIVAVGAVGLVGTGIWITARGCRAVLASIATMPEFGTGIALIFLGGMLVLTGGVSIAVIARGTP